MELIRRMEEKGGKKEKKGVRKGSEDKDITRKDLKNFEIQQQKGVMKRDDWQETLKRAMKRLQYIFRFIIRSRQPFVE